MRTRIYAKPSPHPFLRPPPPNPPTPHPTRTHPADKPPGAGGPLQGRLGPARKKGKRKGRWPMHRPPCPPAFDCNGINPRYWHPHDGIMDEYW